MAQNESGAGAAEIVALEWQDVLSRDAEIIDPQVPLSAYARSELRQLYPAVSHGTLYLSRCTRFPYSRDVPTVFRLVAGGYTVIRLSDGAELGEAATPDEAFALVVDNLPPGTGPAIDGTADDL
ncbi:DUF6193 family natural product biosynthesis protein [Streptomyces sp. BRA346]|uniref:DUF6193 family natural product biosynthesis protein n=1 Tax=Streptomyces sp. BRA346 TaxID=2878199 RepID=UPI004064042C